MQGEDESKTRIQQPSVSIENTIELPMMNNMSANKYDEDEEEEDEISVSNDSRMDDITVKDIVGSRRTSDPGAAARRSSKIAMLLGPDNDPNNFKTKQFQMVVNQLKDFYQSEINKQIFKEESEYYGQKEAEKLEKLN